jgi:argininosuccinate lyase
MSATYFIESRRGIGGPQPAETERMLAGHRARVADLEAWLGGERARLRAADEARNRAFARLTMASTQ